MRMSEIVDNRFGLGARGAVQQYDNPQRSLLRQIERFDARPPELEDMPSKASVGKALSDYVETLQRDGAIEASNMMAGTKLERNIRAVKFQNEIRKFAVKSGRDHYFTSIAGRFATAVYSDTPFIERLTHFWANHFAVSIDKAIVVGFAGMMEFEAIRPNVSGKFSDLLKAIVDHPAMLLYLDQVQSIGPNSTMANKINKPRRKRQLGLNENLAREIMELHTLGVDGGYSQSDVTEFARALTGWTVRGLSRGPAARQIGMNGTLWDVVFVDAAHEPGSRTVMGQNYNATGKAQAERILDDLATHPSTARFLSTKLARHFLSDNPPAAMVSRMEKAFLKSGGDLPSLYRALIESPEMWESEAQKFKQPWEWLVSAYRAADAPVPKQERHVSNILGKLGQPVWRPGSPAGWGDENNDWIGPDSLYKRLEMANIIAARMFDNMEAGEIASRIFPSGFSEKTRMLLARAATPKQALAMLFVSPEFLMR